MLTTRSCLNRFHVRNIKFQLYYNKKFQVMRHCHCLGHGNSTVRSLLRYVNVTECLDFGTSMECQYLGVSMP